MFWILQVMARAIGVYYMLKPLSRTRLCWWPRPRRPSDGGQEVVGSVSANGTTGTADVLHVLKAAQTNR